MNGNAQTDVLIAGAGAAGLALGLALRRAFGDGLRVAVADAALSARAPSVRTSALSAASRRMLEALGVWDALADRAQPIVRMTITDSRRNDAVRPAFLHFDAPDEEGAPYAHMIRNADLEAVLEDAARAAGVALPARRVTQMRPVGDAIDVGLEGGARVCARLLVGADGARSRVRRMSGVELLEHDYGKAAIVATLAHEEDHHGVATQHFLPAGPFAMLPMPGRQSSIVWTEDAASAADYARLPDEDFAAEVERRFGRSLGALSVAERPAAFPLRLQIARRFTKGRMALIGDAAHVVHPLAGQGVNLAYRDVAALVDAIAEAVRLGLDPGASDVLSGYERARRFDTMSMAAATHGLHALFSNDSVLLRAARDFGLGLVDRSARLKATFAREAAGSRGAPPSLLRGRLP